MTEVTLTKMGLFDFVKKIFTRKTTVTTQDVKPTTKGVKVTDFTSGESVKTTTTTSPSGKTTVQRTASGSGGGSVSQSREQQLVQATKELETIQAEKKLKQAEENKLSPTEERKFESQLKDIESRVEEQPLGTPDTTKKSRFKRFTGAVSDVFTGLTLGTFFEHLSRPTALSSEEIKKEAQESTKKAIKDTTLAGFSLPFGEGFGVKTTGELGFGKSSLLGSLQTQQILSAVKIRESGEKIISAQTKQVEDINKAVKVIETEQSKMSDTTQFTKDIDKFTQDVSIFEHKVKTISGKSDFASLEKERKDLLKTREDLIIQQEKFSLEQKKFENTLVSELKDLRKIGVKTDFTKEGQIEFTSKALETKVAPVGIKLQKDFLKGGKFSAKNIAFTSTAITREVGITYGIGVATGGIGLIARLGSKVARLPKAIRLSVKGAGLGLAGVGITTTTIRGFQAGKIEGIGKIGAIIGGLTATGQLTGFGAGAFRGTKSHFKRIEESIISGRTTRSIAELKTGAIIKGQGGIARQLSKFETKITGTKFKILSIAELKTKFITGQGTSDVKVISKLVGKVPKGIPVKVITKGQTLETPELIKARLFTQVPKVRGESKFFLKQAKVKGFIRQDILISRKILDVKTVGLDKLAFKPFVKLQSARVLAIVKNLGASVKVKKIPKDIFTFGEKHLFRVLEGKQKVAGFGELSKAKLDSIFTSKQFILTTKQIKVGDLKIKAFTTLAKTKGVSKDLLKDFLRGKILVLDLKTKQLSALSSLDKGGRLAVFRPQRVVQPVPKIKTPKIKLDFKPQIDSRVFLKVQLSKIVPQILARESALIKPFSIPTTSSLIGIKEILRIRVLQMQGVNLKNISALKLDLGLKISQITQQKVLQVPALKIAQIPKISLMLAPITPQLTTTMVPKVFVPVIPKLPPFILGKKARRKKKKKGDPVSDILVFSEGFTAKQLGFKPRVLSPAQARKLLSIKLTGLGIRRGIIVR